MSAGKSEENPVAVEHKNSPSNSAESFQFGAKFQIFSGQSKNAECFRTLTFNNSFPKFSNRKKDKGGWNRFLPAQE
jgi:hypothetical protein